MKFALEGVVPNGGHVLDCLHIAAQDCLVNWGELLVTIVNVDMLVDGIRCVFMLCERFEQSRFAISITRRARGKRSIELLQLQKNSFECGTIRLVVRAAQLQRISAIIRQYCKMKIVEATRHQVKRAVACISSRYSAGAPLVKSPAPRRCVKSKCRCSDAQQSRVLPAFLTQ